MIIEKMYRKTKSLKRKLKPIRKMKKLAHYTKKTYKKKTQTKAEKNFYKAFDKWKGLKVK